MRQSLRIMEQVCGGGMWGVKEFPLPQHNKEPFESAFSETLPEPYILPIYNVNKIQ